MRALEANVRRNRLRPPQIAPWTAHIADEQKLQEKYVQQPKP